VAAGQYEWATEEQLHIHMSDAIVTCALRAANDLFELGRYDPAEQAVRAGLRGGVQGAPKDPHLQRLLERIVDVRREGLLRPGRLPGDSGTDREGDLPDPGEAA
jgi:hypothetical protein